MSVTEWGSLGRPGAEFMTEWGPRGRPGEGYIMSVTEWESRGRLGERLYHVYDRGRPG